MEQKILELLDIDLECTRFQIKKPYPSTDLKSCYRSAIHDQNGVTRNTESPNL